MAVRTIIAEPVPEKSTFRYQADLKKDDGTALLVTDLDTLTLTISDLHTGAIVNSVNDTNIKNAGRGAIDGTGHLTLISELGDSVILDTSKQFERRLLTFKGTYVGGTRAVNHEVLITIPNMPKVT
jgi:hypothetical protein